MAERQAGLTRLGLGETAVLVLARIGQNGVDHGSDDCRREEQTTDLNLPAFLVMSLCMSYVRYIL
jgi:hypothetical protein